MAGDDDWTPETTDMVSKGERAPKPANSTTGKRAHLVGLLGAGAGKRFPIEGMVLIGRDIDAQVRLDARDLSRRHARVSRTEAGDYLLEDLGGAPSNRSTRPSGPAAPPGSVFRRSTAS